MINFFLIAFGIPSDCLDRKYDEDYLESEPDFADFTSDWRF